jgi:hypothetical protein
MLVNQKAREERVLARIKANILKAFKPNTCCGEYYVHREADGSFLVTFENGLGGFHWTMADIVNEDGQAVLKESGEIGGRFDWAADTYLKDSSWVTFKI